MFIFIKVFVYLLILWCMIYHAQCESKNYCNREFCRNSKQHIMCKFQSVGPARVCKNYEKLLNTEKEKQNVLDRINSRRNKVASGDIRSLPPAENMLTLVWSGELEDIAQRWADQCVDNTSAVTEWCHDLENTSVGQTISTIYGDSPGLTAAALVDVWYMELLNIDATYLTQYKPSSVTTLQHYDYFTQLVWAESAQVGCGGAKYNMETPIENSNKVVYLLICNFAPSGNVVGQSVYSDGTPCSRCFYADHCDSEYPYLCPSFSHSTLINLNNKFQETTPYSVRILDYTNLNNFPEVTKAAYMTEATARIELSEGRNVTTTDIIMNSDNVNDSSFDFLSHLFDITSTHTPNSKETTLSCKDVLPVYEFIELLKSKLSKDQSLKDLLLTSNITSTPEPSFTDRTVAAIVNQLYSKKETTITTKSTHEENINSTILADLVEAVIFRHSDRLTTAEDSNLNSLVTPNVNLVKIQAELGEIQTNTEFTGHYFFPEDEKKTESEVTEIYDDPENSYISEISIEIEDLKKNRETKDFLEEILESDVITESLTREQLDLNNNVTYYKKLQRSDSLESGKSGHYDSKENNRIKRKLRDFARELNNHRKVGGFLKYSDLLQQLAADIRKLQLNKKFHCSSEHFINNAEKLIKIYKYVIIHCLFLNFLF